MPRLLRRATIAFLLLMFALDAHAQSWTAPRTWTTGELVTAVMMNTHVRDNLTVLRTGAIAIASQAANEVIFASSTTQLSRSTSLTFDGTTLTTANISTGLGAVELAAGTYTPTLTNTGNLDASTANECQYLRVGNSVTASCEFNVDPTTGGATSTTFELTLPVASNFGGNADGAGAFGATIVTETGYSYANPATDRMIVEFWAQTTGAHNIVVHFTYQVI